jgi:hypothetical protein
MFRVDFNSFDETGKYLVSSLMHATSHRIPRVGERALLSDGEGNQCWAVVRRVRGIVVYLDLEDETWVTGPTGSTTTALRPSVSLTAQK